MRHTLRTLAAPLLLCAVMVLPAVSVDGATNSPSGPEMNVHNINGYVWLDSTQDAKLNFLLGVECAIAMECAMADASAGKAGTAPAYTRFQKGWVSAFDNMDRRQIADKIDRYYLSPNGDKNRHVFDVVWTEMILPSQRQARQ